MELGRKFELQTIVMSNYELTTLSEISGYDWLYDHEYGSARIFNATTFREELAEKMSDECEPVDIISEEHKPFIGRVITLLSTLSGLSVQFVAD